MVCGDQGVGNGDRMTFVVGPVDECKANSKCLSLFFSFSSSLSLWFLGEEKSRLASRQSWLIPNGMTVRAG